MTSRSQHQSGFTLMEIVVATTIFATVLTLMLVLFNYTLKINRRVESLRQVSQATRNFTEFLAREIRNGSIDYSGTIDATNCPASYTNTNTATYLALVSRQGERECFYLVPNGATANLWLRKISITGVTSNEQINPANVTLDPARFRFFVRPVTNPRVPTGGLFPGVQPFVTMIMHLTVRLNGADQPAVIPYQTTVSTDIYDIPHR